MDDNKKTGARDISDLKARLGLKKTGTMATVTPEAAAPSTNLAASPGAPGAIPAPFGQPAAPVAAAAPAAPPDPRRDPFSAQQQQQAANLAAFYGYGQALPGSADSGPDSAMEKKTPWALIGGVAVGVAFVFGIGMAWGGISKSRGEFNETTDHAIVIRTEVEKLQKVLDTVIAEFRKGGAGKPDLEQAARLKALGLGAKKPNTNVIFHTNYAQLEGLGMERLFAYYNMTIKLYDDIETHAKRTEADKEAIQKMLDNAKNAEKNYGVILDQSGAIPLARFVEMGSPVCPTPGQVDCSANELKGFKYRLEAGSPWSEKPVKGKPGETVTPLQRTPLFMSVAQGSTDALAVEAYGRRVKTILEEIGELEKINKELMADLKKTAERPKVFTF